MVKKIPYTWGTYMAGMQSGEMLRNAQRESQGIKRVRNLPKPTKPYDNIESPMSNAKQTTIQCESTLPRPLPKRVSIHSAPVVTLDLRSHADKNIIRKIWLNVGQSQGIQILLRPYTNNSVTNHIVPEISNIPDASESPNMYHGIFRPPSKYDDLSF